MTSTPINYARHRVDPETLDAFAEALLALEDPAFMRACQQLVLYAEGNSDALHNRKLLTLWRWDNTTHSGALGDRAVGVFEGLQAWCKTQTDPTAIEAHVARYGLTRLDNNQLRAAYRP